MAPEVGTEAPDFTVKDQNNQDVTLSSFRGKKAVAILFYPYAFSGVCTGELWDVRDNHPELTSGSVQLLAVSCDPMFALRELADRDTLTFPLLSDFWPHGEVATAYGVFDAGRGCANRSTFVLDSDGVVRWEVHNAMPDARDLEEQSRVLAALTGPVE